MSEPSELHDQRSVDHGRLPVWHSADMPEPRPFTLRNIVRTIGPGAILLAGSIGGGEWIVGPLMAVTYGTGILWIATIGIALQMMFNLEAIRYTLYTGEPILTGIMRLSPGPKVWGGFYIALGVAQLATPALALGCANVVFAAVTNRLPAEDGSDGMPLLWISYGVLLTCVVLLLSGKSIERLLERLSWAMTVLIFGFLLVVNLLFVPAAQWLNTFMGFVTFSAIPADMDIMLLALFAATAGSGGIGNLVISNWARDKGFGMGAHSGGFGGILASDHVELASTGHVFPMSDENHRRWRVWWKYTLVDQMGLWALGCAVGMFLNVNLAASIIPAGSDLSGYTAGAFQARYMADQLWQGFWALCLLNGFWILLSTHIGNTDGLTRTIADICWSSSSRMRRLEASRLYAGIIMILVAWGLVALGVGENALSLFKVLGVMASPILAIAAVQILRVNTRFLPRELRPPWWRRAALVACALFYGGVSAMIVLNFVRGA